MEQDMSLVLERDKENLGEAGSSRATSSGGDSARTGWGGSKGVLKHVCKAHKTFFTHTHTPCL